MANLYEYKGKVIKIVDGDTIDIQVDLGFSIYINQRVRLYGIDTPELNSKNPTERLASLHIKSYLNLQWLNQDVYIKSVKGEDKYGRYLALIYNRMDVSLNQFLTDNRFAKLYFGDKKSPWTDDELNVIIGAGLA